MNKDESPADFLNIMRRAEMLEEQDNSEGLKDLIKLVLRKVQSVNMLDAYIKSDHHASSFMETSSELGFKGNIPAELDGELISDKSLRGWLWSKDCFIRDKSKYPVLSLSRDIIFPTPWEPMRIINNLGTIGNNRPRGKFKQDPNHLVLYLYPLMIGFVGGGNHSLLVGILEGEGEVIPEEYYDISCLLPSVKFDGTNWVSTITGTELGSPDYPEIGWVWEIAKLYLATISRS